MVTCGFLYLFGAIQGCDNDDENCLKFKKPNKKICKSTRCRLFGIGMIIFGLFFLIMKNPGLRQKVREGGKGPRTVFTIFVMVVLLTCIAVSYTHLTLPTILLV